MTRVDRSGAFGCDLRDAVQWYAREVNPELAERLVNEVERAVRSVGARPGLGSRHYGDVAGIPGIRSRRIEGFPYVVIFASGTEAVRLLRLLHTSRDIGETLRETD
ncbi:type II toxin-antitoxin system RelE/ParE family toxin [Nocardioides sp.]|uniref:type II toxin-antitoxin system RelE/ParE family toxin n=1 Tax=Nocardioides sp. TaxID=35761 RepID=UPI002608F02E|nr:type II toxin-antitoxin system RelE/ParE family toxin [Nocardioides sp.]